VAEFESSAEAALLARLGELHRDERAPEQFRARLAQHLAVLASAEAQPRRAARGRPRTQRWMWLPALAAAAAIGVWMLARERDVIPLREVSTRPANSAPVSFRGSAVPGSLRWRQSGLPSHGPAECEYHFELQPDGAPRELRVVWKECDFPQALKEMTRRRSSSITDVDVRVFVSGSWSEFGELQATELRVLAP